VFSDSSADLQLVTSDRSPVDGFAHLFGQRVHHCLGSRGDLGCRAGEALTGPEGDKSSTGRCLFGHDVPHVRP
jgi:hypothetical protein